MNPKYFLFDNNNKFLFFSEDQSYSSLEKLPRNFFTNDVALIVERKTDRIPKSIDPITFEFQYDEDNISVEEIVQFDSAADTGQLERLGNLENLVNSMNQRLIYIENLLKNIFP